MHTRPWKTSPESTRAKHCHSHVRLVAQHHVRTQHQVSVHYISDELWEGLNDQIGRGQVNKCTLKHCNPPFCDSCPSKHGYNNIHSSTPMIHTLNSTTRMNGTIAQLHLSKVHHIFLRHQGFVRTLSSFNLGHSGTTDDDESTANMAADFGVAWELNETGIHPWKRCVRVALARCIDSLLLFVQRFCTPYSTPASGVLHRCTSI